MIFLFNVGDTVLYGTQGVCKITDITLKQLGKAELKYYCLKPVYQPNNTIFVPVENQALTQRMRRVLSEEEIEELITAMPDEQTVWIENDLERNAKYREMISSGDRHAVVRVIKTLYFKQLERQKCGKRLHINDEILLSQAETLLHNELALVLNITPEQVVPFLMREIDVKKL